MGKDCIKQWIFKEVYNPNSKEWEKIPGGIGSSHFTFVHLHQWTPGDKGRPPGWGLIFIAQRVVPHQRGVKIYHPRYYRGEPCGYMTKPLTK